MVTIDNVTLSDFNVDPDRKKNDILAEKMKFEATMHCAVLEHIGEKSSSTIDVAYTKGKKTQCGSDVYCLDKVYGGGEGLWG